MAGKSKAVRGGAALADLVLKLGEDLGLEVKKGFKVGRRIWGAERYIDVILIHKQTRKTLGIECKYQATSGIEPSQAATEVRNKSVTITAALRKLRCQRGSSDVGRSGSARSRYSPTRLKKGRMRMMQRTTRNES